MLKFLSIFFIWMKYYHIFKHGYLYKKINNRLAKYAWVFYVLKVLYPIWLIFGILFINHIIFGVLIGLLISKYLIYPLIRKWYPVYELFESILCIILYLLLLIV
jgi:hypothetical protein